MYLKKLSLSNFKNCSKAELQLSDKINCFVGDNGAGKTNILDAIHYLSFCKSYFNLVDTQNIKHNEQFFAIHGDYNKNGDKLDHISCTLETGHKKQVKLNKKLYNRLADHIGMYPLVMVSPYDRDLINEGSDLRRKYIDSVISQFDKVYLDDLIQYNKALQHRNALLKLFAEKRYFDWPSLEMWDEQLIRLGSIIHEKRRDFIKDFIPIFKEYFSFISSNKENISISYQSQLEENNLKELLEKARDNDRMARYTTVGIHKDDLVFEIDGYPLKKFGSQGQQKSYVIAIKLAQFEFTKNLKGFKPVLLFDDIFDKLDENRVKQIVKLVSDNSFGQVFITDTQKERIDNIFMQLKIEHKIFRVDSGNISEIESL